jgi:Met-zincin/Domain of unknown function (DUF5117)/Domain of unknown function (DUF5118)
MRLRHVFTVLAAVLTVGLTWGSPPAAAATLSLQGPPGGGRGGRGGRGERQQEAPGPKPYDEVITEDAVTREGMFKTHMVGDDLFFEIPERELGKEMVLIARNVADSRQSSTFSGGSRMSRFVVWERDGNYVVLKERLYGAAAEGEANIARTVDYMRQGPIIARFSVAAFGPDSAAVIDVTSLYTSTNAEMGSLEGVQSNRSWIDNVVSFPDNVEVHAVQTGSNRPTANRRRGGPPAPPSPRGRGGATDGPSAQTATIHWSMRRLPDVPMMPRLHDARVGFNSNQNVEYGGREHRTKTRRIIRRFRLEKKNPDRSLSDPVEPIIYWIDPATPEWLKPWVKAGVERWQEAFEEAGFTNAIFGRFAPSKEEDPDFSLFDARYSAIYWLPSTTPNANGGQIVDPRSGEILKGEVRMYHNIMNLLTNWYFTQVAPLDERAQELPLPDDLMGRLVQYVVTHEIGHSIGLPHNMKASSQYPADSVRSVSFLRRMGHVSTLMDYSRMNYVAQPEDSIPPELLIPRIGPYDRFAVRWGYRPILGATTPEEELETLNEWAREQDTKPWLRWTTSDSPNDPGALTEAVGDADAVYSSTLALKNLQRVMEMLVGVTEKEGKDYSQLDELYGQAVSQWGRYMGHVAAVVGGAETQERLGTGPRFEPVSKERQQEAIAFLAENAFETPEMFIDAEILARVEASGLILRLRQAQGRVITTLLNKGRMDRLSEYEALAPNSDDVFTAADLMEGLRGAIWGELDERTVTIDVYRRNLQRAFLETVERQLNPPPPGEASGGPGRRGGFGQQQPRWESDQRPVLRGELVKLDALAEAAIERAGNAMTRLHLRDIRMEIERILDGED